MAKQAYAIKDFDTVSSKRDARKNAALVLRWISVPIDLNSTGMVDLIEEFEDDAPAIYGAWVLLVQLAAQCPTPGVLLSSNGRPVSPAIAASRTRMPESAFERLFSWAIRSGWLVESGEVASGDSPDDRRTFVRRLSGQSSDHSTGQDITDMGAGGTLSPSGDVARPVATSSRGQVMSTNERLADWVVTNWNGFVGHDRAPKHWPRASRLSQKARRHLEQRIRIDCGGDHERFRAEFADRLQRSLVGYGKPIGDGGWGPSLPWLLTANGWSKSEQHPRPDEPAAHATTTIISDLDRQYIERRQKENIET